MAKHPKRRFNLRKVRCVPTQALGTLANLTAVSTALTGTSANVYRAMSARLTWTLKNMTVGEGPILFGYAHSDYSATEIKEWLESQSSIDIGNKLAAEQGNRLIRQVGVFDAATADSKFNEGRPMKTKLNWAIGIGDAVNLWWFNDSGAVLTTGGVADANGALWVKDPKF